jgi:hypothetical protein
MGLEAKKLAICDVKFVGKADNKTIYTDFRRVLERKDIDVVAIATPPHWHALISVAAMEAGKDVLCEKPMTRFIGEGRAVAEAEKRYKRIFQVGTFSRFGKSKDPRSIEIHKIMASGLLKNCQGVHIKSGGLKVKQWSGIVNAQPQPTPKSLDWDMYCGRIAAIGTTKAAAWPIWASTITILFNGSTPKMTPARLRLRLMPRLRTPRLAGCGAGSN